MKKNIGTVAGVLVVLFLSTSAFARMGGGMHGDGSGFRGPDDRFECDADEHGGRGMHGYGEGPEMQHLAMMPEVNFLFDYLNLDDQMRKTELQIEKVRLAEREKSLDLVSEAEDLGRDIRDLMFEAKTNSSVKQDLINKMKRANELHKKLRVIREDSREKIQSLHSVAQKEVQKKIDQWIDKLSTDDVGFQKFLDFAGNASYSCIDRPEDGRGQRKGSRR